MASSTCVQRSLSQVTVAEYERITSGERGIFELRHGVILPMSFPKPPHKGMQRRLRVSMAGVAGPEYVVDTEYPFRPLPEYELWAADVMVTLASRIALRQCA